jgi:hypothetical protein
MKKISLFGLIAAIAGSLVLAGCPNFTQADLEKKYEEGYNDGYAKGYSPGALTGELAVFTVPNYEISVSTEDNLRSRARSRSRHRYLYFPVPILDFRLGRARRHK